MKRNAIRALALAMTAALAAPAAQATNGYFKIGYGTKNRGLAGAGVALGTDALAPGVNPATLTQVGNRIDFGIELFNPRRDARLDAGGLDVSAATGGAVPNLFPNAQRDSGVVKSGATLFAIPNAGFSFNMGNMTVGLSVLANGGMNTRYNSNIFSSSLGRSIGCTDTLALCGGVTSGFAGMIDANTPGGVGNANVGVPDAILTGLYTNPNTGTLGVNLSQVILAPTVAMEVADGHSIGVSLLVAAQRFRAYGLGLFQALSTDPGNVTNQGDDEAYGAGIRIGWTGRLTDSLSVGLVAASKIYMQEFDQYKGLFANQGDFDVPANFAIGLALKVSPRTTLALDVQRILYSGVDSIHNPGPTADEFFTALTSVLTTGSYSGPGALGSDNGWGFGWDDITVVKLGIEHVYNDHWTFRGGINVGGNPIDNDQNLFNILAPGVVRKHLTLGFTYSPDDYSEVSVSYMHAFREDQTFTYQGTGSNAAFSFDAGIGMDQNALEVSYGMKF